ncbi:MAG TPA: chemotaxis protein [Xanthobacteraceae bacterium]|nr:chemotaxis protein [Xanthobacteraceae bacterium]
MALIEDSALRRELNDIADYIRSLRGEISALQANDMRHKRIPAAGQELAAIIKATEEASNTIMACAEAAMAAEAADLAAYRAFVADRMTAVFEACSFHDLTGQRLAKVVDTLKHIETRISRFAEATAVKDATGHANEAEAADAERKLRLLIHGPSLAHDDAGQGTAGESGEKTAKDVSQDEIDQLFT